MARTYSPPGATGDETAERLQSSSVFAKHHVFDPYPCVIFELVSLLAAGPADLLGTGTGAPTLTEIATSEICGIFCDTATDSQGYLWTIPAGLDFTEDVGFRVLWGCDDTGTTGGIQWAVKYTTMTCNSAAKAIAVGATALDTAIANDAPLGTANALQMSPWGVLDADTLTLDPFESALAISIIYAAETTVTDASVYELHAYYSRFAL